jgi:long-chain acyl-CoA synthetase
MRLATFLAANATARPHADAVLSGDRRLSFAELDESTTRLANALRGRGIGVGDRVALALPNGVEFVQAFLAVVKAGAVAVPVNTRLAPDEVAFILADCAPAGVLCGPEEQQRYLTGRAGDGLLIVSTGADPGFGRLAAEGGRTLPEVPVDADDCVISYTSGTTGTPKGAILTQANYIVLNGFLNGLMWGLRPDDRQLITTPLAQRTGLARIMNMVCHGCAVVIPPRFDAAAAAELIEAERITLMGTVPTVARMLLPEIERDPARFASLRVFIATGESFPMALRRRLHAALPQTAIHSFYALTEVGLVAWMGPDEQFDHPTSVGRVQPGVEARLLDSEQRAVPVGEVGELWVRSGPPGRFLSMRGYYGRPEETAQTIRDGWVATGDLGRFDEAGYLQLVDRKKDMIVSGGFNVYSKEVELAIADHPDVRDVAVIGVPDEIYGEAVTAFVEPHPGARLTVEDIVDHCRPRIAGYKKPRHVYFVPELPRNSTGKVLKRQLPALRPPTREEVPR